MTEIIRPAAMVKQGTLKLFTTSLRVADLMQPGFCRIDKLDPENGSGFQRLLNKSRARRLAEYLIAGQAEKDAFLPTSIFLATSATLEFDESRNLLRIDTSKTGSLNVVDGQHRIAGLIEAAAEVPELRNFEIPANVAVGIDDIAQMCHFLIVNTTQKSVDKDVEQQIIARLSGMISIEKVPSLPKWIRRQVEKRDDEKAISLARYLNSEESSVWRGRIEMANQEDDLESRTISQRSFVSALKKYIFTASNPIATMSMEQQQRVMNNYWRAVASLLHEPSQERSTVLFKTGGLEVFSIASLTVFTHCATRKSFLTDEIRALLRRGLENLPAEFAGAAHPDWWLRGGGASGMNQAAMRKLAHAICSGMNASASGMDIAI